MKRLSTQCLSLIHIFNTVDVQLQKAIGRMWDMLSRYISGTEN